MQMVFGVNPIPALAEATHLYNMCYYTRGWIQQ